MLKQVIIGKPTGRHRQQHMENIIKHFDKYLPLDEIEKEALTKRLTERKIKRKQYILQEGDICNYFTYVIEGCFKMYGEDKSGVEHNLVFAAEDDWITDMDSLHKERPSKLFIEAVVVGFVMVLIAHRGGRVDDDRNTNRPRGIRQRDALSSQ